MQGSESIVPLPLKILGTCLNPLERCEAIRQIEKWIECGERVVMEAQRDRNFRGALQAASLCLLDGMPLVWIARAKGTAAFGARR